MKDVEQILTYDDFKEETGIIDRKKDLPNAIKKLATDNGFFEVKNLMKLREFIHDNDEFHIMSCVSDVSDEVVEYKIYNYLVTFPAEEKAGYQLGNGKQSEVMFREIYT